MCSASPAGKPWRMAKAAKVASSQARLVMTRSAPVPSALTIGGDGLAAVDVGLGHLPRVAERADAAPGQLALQVVAVLLGLDDGHAEAQALVAGDLAHQVQRPHQLLAGAVADRAGDDERDPASERRLEHERDVVLDELARAVGEAGADVERPRIVGARLGADEVGVAGEAARERVLRERHVAERAGGRDGDDLLHRVSSTVVVARAAQAYLPQMRSGRASVSSGT